MDELAVPNDRCIVAHTIHRPLRMIRAPDPEVCNKSRAMPRHVQPNGNIMRDIQMHICNKNGEKYNAPIIM